MRPASLAGLAMGIVFLGAALPPSLLPRHWAVQAILVGIVTAIGYGLGTAAAYVARSLVRRPMPPQVGRAAWWIVGLLGTVGLAVATVWASGWQQELHRSVGLPAPSSAAHAASVTLGLVLAGVLVLTARTIRWATRRTQRLAASWMPRRVANALAVVAVAALVVGLLDGLVTRGLFDAADEAFRLSDGIVDVGAARPTSRLRSGSPSSPVPWESLGSQGRDFVAGGPTADDIAGFTGRAANTPIRVYVGLDAHEDDHARAALVVDELERTGAFDRAVLCVVTTTGTGWVDPEAAAALEYLWGGDTALATMQYSYLPSWLSFLVDSTRAREAGAELFDAVHERWSALPEDDRPRLVVLGTSLGAYGAEAAFSGVADLRNRSDGALLVGPPNFSEMWRTLTDRRDPGTPERLPVYDGGITVRFVAHPADLTLEGHAWPEPRVVYLQHPTDPVVWWSPRLLLRRPDWLDTPVEREGLPALRWFPFVTFWQLTADLADAERMPAGYGHNYGVLPADAWAAVAPPPGWSDRDTQRLRDTLAETISIDDRG